MPTVFRSGDWKITMYFLDHPPPHFHVVTASREEAQVRIADLTVMAGRVAVRVLASALRWAGENRTALSGTWDELHPA